MHSLTKNISCENSHNFLRLDCKKNKVQNTYFGTSMKGSGMFILVLKKWLHHSLKIQMVIKFVGVPSLRLYKVKIHICNLYQINLKRGISWFQKGAIHSFVSSFIPKIPLRSCVFKIEEKIVL